MRWSVVLALVIAKSACGDDNTISADGIDSVSTGLTGAGVLIGQSNQGRSGKFGFDMPDMSAMGTVPAQVYFRTSTDTADSDHITLHETLGASVMIGTSSVAPSASLYSAAFGPGGIGGANDVDVSVTMNRLALLFGGTIQTIDMSFNRPLGFTESADGTSYLTSFVDWSARRQDVLYTIAWGNNDQSFPATPVDNFNGITVAASEQQMGQSKWNKVASLNQDEGYGHVNAQNVDIMAPGVNVAALGFNSDPYQYEGTSAATPHVTGASALLHQYATQNSLSSNAHRHQVMKAVMMNSADKLSGVQGSNRTILDRQDMDWTQSEAYLDPTTPLDDQMGAGHLNVRRAVQQLAANEQGPGNVQLLGWDYGSYGSGGQQAVYTLSGSVPAGHYITVTLVWDRIVETPSDTVYNSGDTFSGYEMADLNLAIERTDGTVLRTSVSDNTNYEHIFYPAGSSEDIRITVGRFGSDGPATGNYAIAWWAGNASPMPGDYNRNGSVGPEDYDVWKSNFGTNFADADGNENGVVDAADYTVWRNNYTPGSGSFANVPEPPASALMLVGFVFAFWGRGRGQRN